MHDALAAEHRARHDMQSAQWARDNAAPPDYRDSDADDAEDEPDPDPEHKPLFNVDAELNDARESAWKYTRTQPEARLSYEAGILAGKLKEAAALIDMLQRELQTAINDGVCNSYINAGHLDRVEQNCGIVVPKEYRE